MQKKKWYPYELSKKEQLKQKKINKVTQKNIIFIL